MSVSLRFAARSDLGLGSKSRNEDSAYAGPELLVLCDGMGGHAAGDVASSLVVGELVHLDGESHGGDDLVEVLRQAIKDANAALHEETLNADQLELDGMGTTCIAMLRSGDKLAVANIGDSRAYLLRGGRFAQITKDHSFVQSLLDEGRITPEEALHHPQRSLITRVLTGKPEDEPDTSLRALRAGDRILICSDGLSDYVAHDTIGQILATPGSGPGQIADRLIQIALRASTRDNVTVVVAEAVEAADTGSTTAQVVGAAGERRGTQLIPGAPQTPAEKAAALSRQVRGADDDDVAPTLAEEDPSSGPVAWLKRLLVTVIVLGVLVGAGYAAYDWTQRQFYVGEADGNVAIYRGVSQDLGPISLSSVETSTSIPVDQLPRYFQGRVRETLSASSMSDAERMVEDLRAMALQCEVAAAGTRGCPP